VLYQVVDSGVEMCFCWQTITQPWLTPGTKVGLAGYASRRINRGGKLSPYTIFAYVRDIKVFWSWLLKRNYIKRNALVDYPLPKVPKLIMKTLSYEQIRKLLTGIDKNSPRGAMRYCIVILLLDTGIRVAELVNLRISDLDFNHKTVKVFGKGQRERYVPISVSTRKALVNYINNHRSSICRTDSPYLFTNEDGEAFTVNAVQQFLRRLAIKSGISNVRCSPHVFRHTFATLAVNNGANIETLRVIMGHESIQTTSKYTHISTSDLQKQHSQFSPLNTLFVS